MARISDLNKYPNDTNINPSDSLIGTDSSSSGKTKNFSIDDLSTYFNNSSINTLLNVKFGDTKINIQNIEPTSKSVIFVDEITSQSYNCKVYHLIIEFPDFEKFQTKNPKILIDRYKPREILNISGFFRKAGYRHSPSKDGRITEIPLTGVKTIIDITPETYFKFKNGVFRTKGISKRKSYARFTERAYCSIGLRLKVGDMESNHIKQLRMFMIKNPKYEHLISYNHL